MPLKVSCVLQGTAKLLTRISFVVTVHTAIQLFHLKTQLFYLGIPLHCFVHLNENTECLDRKIIILALLGSNSEADIRKRIHSNETARLAPRVFLRVFLY